MTQATERHDLGDLLDNVPVSEAAKRDVVARMGADDRFYHGIDHLAILWRRHRHYAPLAGLQDPLVDTLIASAIAYHDCIYDARRSDSEELSALHWLAAEHDPALSEDDRLWVADTIRATAAHLSYLPSDAFAAEPQAAPPGAVLRERARIWMLDLDLTPLGEPAESFNENTRLLRLEVPHLSEQEWDDARLRFLRTFLASPHLYRSPTLVAAFEAQARRNIARACGP